MLFWDRCCSEAHRLFLSLASLPNRVRASSAGPVCAHFEQLGERLGLQAAVGRV